MLLEVLTGSAPFQGRNELDQAKKIFQVCGWPSTTAWPELSVLPLIDKTTEWDTSKLSNSLAEFLAGSGVDPVWHSFVSRYLFSLASQKFFKIKDNENFV